VEEEGWLSHSDFVSIPIASFNLSLIFLIVCHYPKTFARCSHINVYIHTLIYSFSYFLLFSSSSLVLVPCVTTHRHAIMLATW
jgi:hypothetical protein